ncbi:CRP-like cAMP-binding protein [Enterococcus sp. PF1-24]|uniref:Crp/Fnr family transcriptional regulator n=1 Tax=unclassified Enterococcus TaxID=2608891 RepID=UPI0024759721|nr:MULTISPECIES: Crp/Fnr family transcriptional regulator [unclassified Enterococcus]MDH6365753.1 CRP-like cAMP-binding protein [Enterococcus sp. PFB1-1]MDH6402864.1 CRP-like cAMP-binding protein [Enterococcus sp. PF1-24]
MDDAIHALIQTNLNKYSEIIAPAILQQLINVDNPIKIPKGKIISSENEAFFLLSGILRGFYLDSEGNDITYHFIQENQSYGSDFLTTDKPQICSYEALEDSLALTINLKMLKKLMPENNQLLWLYIQMLEKSLKQKMLRETSLVTKNASQRYCDLITEHPNIEKRVNQIHIASYLGITAVSLSRIRHNIREENKSSY